MRKKATRKQIITTIIVLVTIVGACVWWGPHAYWSYMISRHKFRLVPAKVTTMPAAEPGKNWLLCRAGGFSIRLPPVLAEEAERMASPEAENTDSVVLKKSNTIVMFKIPQKFTKDYRPLVEGLAAKYNMTPMEFIAESYRIGTDDFRWTMSHAALARHTYLVNMATQFYPHQTVIGVETFSGEDIEGIMVIHEGRSFVTYEWRLKSGDSAGFVRFHAEKGELPIEELRAACRSIRCDVSRVSEKKMTKEELAVMVDTLTVEPDESAGGNK